MGTGDPIPEAGQAEPLIYRSFQVIARVGKVDYRLELPAELRQIHNAFHVSELRKCVADETAVVPLNDIQVDDCMNHIEKMIAILDRKVKVLRNKEVSLVQVQW